MSSPRTQSADSDSSDQDPDSDPGSDHGMDRQTLGVLLAGVVVVVLGILAWYFQEELSSLLSDFSEQMADAGTAGAAGFAAVGTVWIAIFLPASMIFLVSGAVWGPKLGLLIALSANFFSGILAFGGARGLLAGRIGNGDPRESKLALIRKAVHKEGMRGAFLLRFSALPVSVVSYGLGAAGVSWKHFLPASLAILPTTWVYVATGHAAGLASGSSERSPGEWALLVASILGTLVIMVLLGKRAKRMLSEAREDAREDDAREEDARENAGRAEGESGDDSSESSSSESSSEPKTDAES